MGNRFVDLLSSMATSEGMTPSLLEGVRFLRASHSVPRHPVVYEPGIFIIGQGRKRGFLGDRVYTYDAQNYLVLSVPLPFECEVEATPAEPLLGLSVRVEPATIAELLLEMDDEARGGVAVPRGIYSTELDAELAACATRLLETLTSPRDAKILGVQIMRELTYRVLCGEQGDALRAVAARHSNFGQISRALRRMHSDYSESLDVETLAEESGMSLSTFHHNFKAVTSSSPLQYLKMIRLHKARLMMVHEGVGAGIAANRVGYESASQFSREFKRFFGNTPADEAERLRAMV